MTADLLQKWPARYGLAVAIVVLAVLARLALVPVIGLNVPYVTVYPAVMIVAVVLGTGPGVLASLVGILLAEFAFMRTGGEIAWDLSFAVRSAIVLGASLYLGRIGQTLRAARARAEAEAAAAQAAQLALRRQVELIDPARAEIIAQEMRRIVRGREPEAPPPAVGRRVWRRLPAVAGILVAGAGLLVLLGWLCGVEAFTCVRWNLRPMQAGTAFGLVLAGTALLLRERRTWRLACAGLLCLVVVVSLAEQLGGVALGLERLLAPGASQPGAGHPGSMSSATVAALLLVAPALLLLPDRRPPVRFAVQALILGTGLIGTIVLVGYLYRDPRFCAVGGASSMSLYTALALVLLAAGMAFTQTEGVFGVLLGDSPGTHLARRLLPVVLLAPPLLGWLFDAGIRRGFYTDASGTALFALSMTVSLAATVLWTALALARADAGRRATETQLRNQSQLMDQADEALIVRELGGVIRFWNRGAASLYGWPAVDAVGQRIHVLLRTEGLPPDHEARLAQAGHWEGELTHTTRTGERVVVESRKTAIRTDRGQALILESNRDITARRKAEQQAAQLHEERRQHAAELERTNLELMASRRAALNLVEDAVAARDRAERVNRELVVLQERAMQDAARLARTQSAADTIGAMHEGVMLLELDGTILSANPAVERLAGADGATLVGRKLLSLLPSLVVGADLRKAQLGVAALRNGAIPVFEPVRLRRPDGTDFHVLPSVALMEAPDGGRQIAVLTLKDVSDLHEVSLRLRKLAERLAMAEEEDRWRISRYIHDSVIQNLSLANIRMGSMVKPLQDASLQAEADKLAQIRGLLGQAIDECRMVMSDLTPALLYELGLVPALDDLARQLQAKHGATLVVQADGPEPAIPHHLRGLLFDSARELIMNAVKHAGTCRIRAAVSRRGSDLVLCVSDDGAGFDTSAPPARANRQGGFGLFNIRQRVEGLGGRLEIRSTPGKGTTATIVVPVGEREA